MLDFYIQKYMQNAGIRFYHIVDRIIDLTEVPDKIKLKDTFAFFHLFQITGISDPALNFTSNCTVISPDLVHEYKRNMLNISGNYSDFDMSYLLTMNSDFIHIHKTEIEIKQPTFAANNIEVISSFIRFKQVIPK